MNKFLEYMMYIIGLILAVLIVVFRNNYFVLVVLIAIGLIIGGIGTVINKNVSGYPMLGIGLSAGVGTIVYKLDLLTVGDSITFVFALSIMLIMILALVIETIRKKQIYATHTLLVDAELVDLIRDQNVKKEVYLPVYSYKVDDEIYEVDYPKLLTRGLPSIGSTKVLRVNPNNHVDVYFETEMKDKAIYVACAVFLSIVSLVIIIGLFK